jgi:hypothetical protein
MPRRVTRGGLSYGGERKRSMINNYNTLAVPRLLGRFLILAAALVAVRCAGAGSITLYAIGAASFGAPTDLNIMNPSLPSSVTNVQTPLDGSIGFNGGLVYNNGMIYGIGNDNNGYASLLSLNNKGPKPHVFNIGGPRTVPVSRKLQF